jgi:predicted RNA-binding protein YlxR (DUF448 family)
MAEARLIRFVAAPDGSVAADLGRKLPGRGLWVEATREALAAVVKKNGFARAAKAPLKPAADLPDRVAQMLAERLLAGLGLARRAGQLLMGFEKVARAAESGRARVLIEATDGAADGRRKMLMAARKAASPPLVVGLFTAGELGLALGGENVIHTAFLAGRAADRWAEDAQRLSGFRPLLPEGWREEP